MDELLEAFMGADFTKSEFKAIMAILRVTSCGKEACKLQPIEIAQLTGIHLTRVSKVLSSLDRKQVISWNRKSSMIRFNKNHEKWEVSTLLSKGRDLLSKVLNRNNQPNNSITNKTTTNKTTTNKTTTNKEWLIKELLQLGIDPKYFIGRYDLKEILEKIELLHYQRNVLGQTIRNPAGWLRAAIERDYKLPKWAGRRREKQKARRGEPEEMEIEKRFSKRQGLLKQFEELPGELKDKLRRKAMEEIKREFDGKLPDYGTENLIKNKLAGLLEKLNSSGIMPYLNESGDLVIPFDSPEKYHWWVGGQSPTETLRELKRH